MILAFKKVHFVMYYFSRCLSRDNCHVSFRQDDPVGKPTSIVADFSLVPDTVAAALEGRQLQPMMLGPKT